MAADMPSLQTMPPMHHPQDAKNDTPKQRILHSGGFVFNMAKLFDAPFV
jgi:hypothetical protein